MGKNWTKSFRAFAFIRKSVPEGLWVSEEGGVFKDVGERIMEGERRQRLNFLIQNETTL